MANDSVPSVPNTFRSRWLDTVAMFIKETQSTSLDLSDKNIGAEDLKVLAKCFPNSHIMKLSLDDNNLENLMKDLSEVLVNAEIRTLDVSGCDLRNKDLFDLFELLKNTEITDLNIHFNEYTEFSADERNKFISFMQDTRLKIFDFDPYSCFPNYSERAHLFQALPETSITTLSLVNGLDYNILISLFSNLHRSSLTDLKLQSVDFDENLIKKLSQSLVNSKLIKLDLFNNKIEDEGVDILVEGLVQSRSVDLDLSCNKIKGSNTLGFRLKDTCITKLNLSGNNMKQHGIFLSPCFLGSSSVTKLNLAGCRLGEKLCQKLMESLRFSKVTKLDISFNNLQLPAISRFAKILEDTNLKKVNFSNSSLTSDASVILGECMRVSKLTHVDLSHCFKHPNGVTILPLFLAAIKDSSIYSVSFCGNELYETGAEMLAVHLKNTTVTHIDLSYNKMAGGFTSLVESLKFTAIVNLNLSSNDITDEGVKVLAEHLSETQLIDLTLCNNDITDCGAEALAHALKDSSLLRLSLWESSKMENSGIEALAHGAENTFITELYVPERDGDSVLLLDSVLLKNQISVQRLVNVFKQISPQANDSFCFDGITTDANVDSFLENCLELYMNIIRKPSTISVLLEEKSLSLSRAQITLMSEEFPKRFCQFVASRVEASVEQHISLLKSAEDKRLNKVVEPLLLNRPLYLIDDSQGILHPYVYLLLNKYNHPLFNLDVEPDAKMKIINYFTEHAGIDGASDVIRLLKGKRKQ